MSALVPGFSNQCSSFELRPGKAEQLKEGDWRAYGKEQPQNVTYLHAKLRSHPHDAVHPINLDEVLGNHRGRFVWRENGMFTDSSDAGNMKMVTRLLHVDLNGDGRPDKLYRTELHTRLRLPDGSWREAYIDLDQHIYYDEVTQTLLPYKLPRSHTVCILLDGTGNEYDDTNTNIVFLTQALHKSDPSVQHVYYQDGLGTYVSTGFWTKTATAIAKTADQAVAWGLDDHVQSAYKFLMNAYQPGSKICVFGFSRGAHTARALVAMVNTVGLLPPHNAEHVPFAYSCYKNSESDKEESDGPKRCRQFLQTFSEEVSIHFVGLWDTVNSTGALWPRVLPGTAGNPDCRFFRHALALDERRVRFKPTIGRSYPKHLCGDIPRVKQIWLAGNHCDVGGGNRPDEEGIAISNIPLRWMIKEIFACKTDILFRATNVKDTDMPDLIEHAKTRQRSIDSYVGIGNFTPFNDWPSFLKPSKDSKLTNWPRAHVAVDPETGEARTGHKHAHCGSHEDLDSHDMLTTIRHDNIWQLKWIFMEFIPTIVHYSEAYKPEAMEKRVDNKGSLNVPQKLRPIINRCQGRDIWPEADGKFHLHESLKHLLPSFAKAHSATRSIVASPVDTTESSPLLPKSGQPATTDGISSPNREPSLSWSSWFWTKLGYPPKQGYLCRGRFHLPEETDDKKFVDLNALLLKDQARRGRGEAGYIEWVS